MRAPGDAAGLAALRPVRLVGQGLVLREWRHADLPAMVELFDDPEVALRTPLPTPFTMDEARSRLAEGQRSDRLLLAITADGGPPLGELFLTATGELAYVVGAGHRGAGIAVRALLLARDAAHRAMSLPVLRLEIEPDNRASRTVARRAGFRLTQPAADVVEDKGRRYVLDVWEHAEAQDVLDDEGALP